LSNIRKVAKDAGVSIATVSRVINNQGCVTADVRERVLEAVNRSGYVPNVGRRTTSLLGLVYAGRSAFGSPYDSALLQGMADAMEVGHLDLMILGLKRDKQPDESFTQFFLRKGVRGVIVRATIRERHICRAIADEGFPSIVLGDHFDHPTLSYVYNDSKATSSEGVEHLVALGHRRIAFAASETDDAEHLDRLQGYLSALQAHGIEPDPRLHFRIPPHRLDGAQLMRNVMSIMNPPTAIYIVDPLVAVGAINEAHRMGIRVPLDLSILGFDDTDARDQVFPRMTAVCQDTRQIGFEAFSSLAHILANWDRVRPVRQVSSCWLEVNGTTAAPPKQAFRVLPDRTRLDI
jgi:DNA-binding LacI/PurR family transcriptional regulator